MPPLFLTEGQLKETTFTSVVVSSSGLIESHHQTEITNKVGNINIVPEKLLQWDSISDLGSGQHFNMTLEQVNSLYLPALT